MTAGAGHRRAAEAMAQAITGAMPQAQVRCHDLLADVPTWLRGAYPATYYFLVRWCGPLWGIGFALFDQYPFYAVVQPFRRAWNRWVGRRFIRSLRLDPPDLIVATHFFPADIVSACKESGWLTTSLVVVVTDLHPHRFWLAPAADAFVVGTSEGFRMLVRRGVAASRVQPLGIPTGHGFHEPVDRQAALARFGLSPQRRTILLTSGDSPVGPFVAVVESLLAIEETLPGRLQLLVVCGHHPSTVRTLQRRAPHPRMPMAVQGFIDTMPEAMGASDLVVTKAGGVTLTEALARGRPLALYHVISGQEQLNARYVVEHGAALIETQPQRLARAVQELFERPERLERMAKAAQALGHLQTASDIVSKVIRPLLNESTVHRP